MASFSLQSSEPTMRETLDLEAMPQPGGFVADADLSFSVFSDGGEQPLAQPLPPSLLGTAKPGGPTMDGPQRGFGDGNMSPSASGRRPFASDESYSCWAQDPMDLDYDPELASWVSSWTLPPPAEPSSQPAQPPLSPPPQSRQQVQQQKQEEELHQQPQQQQQQQQQKMPQIQPQQNQQVPQQEQQQQLPLQLQQQQMQLQQRSVPQLQLSLDQNLTSLVGINSVAVGFTEMAKSPRDRTTGPDDLLFPDDETAAVVFSRPTQNANAGSEGITSPYAAPSNQASAPPALDLNDPVTLALYDEMLLFSRSGGSGNDKLTFDECQPEKEAILHRLALRFQLSYSYDPVQRRACVWNPALLSPLETSQTAERRTSFQASSHFPSAASPNAEQFQRGALHPVLPQTRYNHLAAANPNSQKRHTIAVPMPFSLLQQDTTTTAGSSVGRTPPALKRLSSGSSAAASVSSALVVSGLGVSFNEDDRSEDSPSLGDRLSSSWNIFHSGISSRRPRGRRGPLSAKSRKDIKDLEWAGGACWRCKILRRKCDPGVPCKNCPAPDLREDAPPWPLIGCRRGNLRDAMPPQALCPKSRTLLASCFRKLPAVLAAENVVDNLTGGPPPAQPDIVSQCFREAEALCLSDNKLVLDNPSLYLRARGNSVAAQHFSQAIRNGRYRANESLNTTCHVHEKSSTYSDLISSIAWDLADNSDCLGVLEIESIEGFMLLLETACLYEVEVGKSPMVALSIVCLRCCLDALRLNASNLLGAQLHSTCQSDRCSIDCLRELASRIETYIEELSVLMFRKVNLRDRRWWLSTFYSLCIQAYVRRALLVVEQQLLFPGGDDGDVLYSSQYLHLVTVLFIAVSFQYDPLVSNNGSLRLQQSLLADEDTPVATTDMSVPDRYFAAGRAACGVDSWADEGVKSSYQFLTRLLNIGSLDFDMGQTEGGDVPMEEADAVLPLRHLRAPKITSSFSGYSTPNSSATSFASSLSAGRSTSTGLFSPPSSCGPLSSSSSPRTSLLLPERRSSVGSLPSRLSVASFPSFPSPTADQLHHGGRPPLPSRPVQHPASVHGKAASPAAAPDNRSGNETATATAGTPSNGSTKRSNSDNNNNNTSNTGQLQCTCCPKRPQRFDTVDELKLHQTKKPHICAFCGRRFSRMNEAERHITTIHLRPFSWSCKRLGMPLQAYQCLSDGTMSYDVCGFCGRQFPRPAPDNDESDNNDPSHQRHADMLTAHVEVHHKLRDCKASGKKFYREDMFGQHLKLSHAAEPGIWLKYLENVCKAEEKENTTC
ncbi:c2h2 finger domain containing protein [Niveomyces insectorum RCEF 264]|uniref:C2h2 finger domain containing protein n=1 Tax=Niveomyces insectorum RCEF 264 TaxID=1081102 RepID=A0A167QCA8_9HYPO|nr:c2h2 finger domain containing protein [Niveomyces insectorum RCEF 264]